MSDAPKPLSVAADVGAALVRLADATDRLVFLAEALAVHFGVVDPVDVGMELARAADEETA